MFKYHLFYMKGYVGPFGSPYLLNYWEFDFQQDCSPVLNIKFEMFFITY